VQAGDEILRQEGRVNGGRNDVRSSRSLGMAERGEYSRQRSEGDPIGNDRATKAGKARGIAIG
jgi:hypothetical protein